MVATVTYSRYCASCGTPVSEGPEGGYVCGACFHVVEPLGADEARKARRAERAAMVAEAARLRALTQYH
ncbi:hypothetical protein [Kitasatospora azatica]|uniref:hypothetical protein n=1 Tax=Kitasatospora azatica TaxID=58347 RepID=UPI00056B44B5|nr:hypothetical protein [Kitasatospora azatica]